MGVKDLVGLFEPPATEIQAPNPPATPSERPRSNTLATVASGSNRRVILAGHARFIRHQTRQSIHPDNVEAPEGLAALPMYEFIASSDHLEPEGDQSITDVTVVDDILRSVHDTTLPSSTTDNVQTKSSLIHRHPSSHEPDAPDTQSLLNHTYPPDVNTVIASPSSAGRIHTVRPAIGRVRARVSSTHSPVPAVTVFSRKAAALFLPKLDDYLATLPPPRFSSLISRGTSKDKEMGIFAPMDRLVSLGKTLEDLETNSTILPFWKNRKTLLGGLVNLFLGIMVCQMF